MCQRQHDRQRRKIPIGSPSLAVATSLTSGLFLGIVYYTMSERTKILGRFINNRSNALETFANLPAFCTTLPQRFYLLPVLLSHL